MPHLLPPVTPGELLREEFLEPMGFTAYRLAKEIGVPQNRIGAILRGKRAITADTDLRLCRFFGLSEGYWLRAQVAHDLELAKQTVSDWILRLRSETAERRLKTALRRSRTASTRKQIVELKKQNERLASENEDFFRALL